MIEIPNLSEYSYAIGREIVTKEEFDTMDNAFIKTNNNTSDKKSSMLYDLVIDKERKVISKFPSTNFNFTYEGNYLEYSVTCSNCQFCQQCADCVLCFYCYNCSSCRHCLYANESLNCIMCNYISQCINCDFCFWCSKIKSDTITKCCNYCNNMVNCDSCEFSRYCKNIKNADRFTYAFISMNDSKFSNNANY